MPAVDQAFTTLNLLHTTAQLDKTKKIQCQTTFATDHNGVYATNR